jgi:CelD/BcsL family acetyltransferase involved in cellulose biosynthesis
MQTAGGARLEVFADFDPLRAEWARLAEATGSVFHTYEWHTRWWEHFGAGRELRVVAGRHDDGSLAWVMPMLRHRVGPVRLLRAVGYGAADALGPVAAGDDLPAAAAALRRFVAADRGCDLALFRHLPGALDWGAALGGEVVRRESSPSVELDGLSWDEYLATRSAHFRQHLRRDERVLHRTHDVRFVRTDDAARLEADLDTLFRLHALRWGAATDFIARDGAFHRDFARVAFDRGWLRLWILELDGAPAAAWYGFRLGGADWFYQSGRDPQFDRLRVGALLVAHTIRTACDDGISVYHMLRGGETYKAGFANADDGLQTVMVARGARGRAARIALRVLLRRFPKLATRWSG